MKILAFLGLLLISVSACAVDALGYKPHLSVTYSNLSSSDIKNIKSVWTGDYLITSHLKPGKGKTEIVYKNNIKDFYGTVHLTWENAAGKKFEKFVEFTENDMPISSFQNDKEFLTDIQKKQTDYNDPRSGALSVYFEFTQEGFSYYTKQAENSIERRKASVKKMKEIRKGN